METFMRTLFAALLRNHRNLSTQTKALRVDDICKQLSYARSQWYRWEKGLETPLKVETLDKIAALFEFKKYSDKWFQLFNYAYLAHNAIPPYLREHYQILHTIFIQVHRIQPTVEEMEMAMKYIEETRIL